MDCLGSATCHVVDFVVSDNNCIDVVGEADAVGSVTSSRDASSCNCFEFDRMHQKLEHVGGRTGSSRARIRTDCLMTTSGDSFEP